MVRITIFNRLKKNVRGAALIEFAIITPVLIILLLGIIEFGWLFNGWITITSAAREGARIAIIKTADENFHTLVQEAVENHATTLHSINANISTKHEKIKGTDYNSVTVIATGQLEPLVSFFVIDSVTLTGQATMRMYN